MSNKYLYILVGAIVAAVWFYTGNSAYYKGETGMSDDWWYAMILAVGLGAGSTGGNDLVSILSKALRGISRHCSYWAWLAFSDIAFIHWCLDRQCRITWS